jgi:hypothetical protein
MSTLKIATVAAALSVGMIASANAQYGGRWGGQGYQHHGYHQQAPVWVPPKVQRKQAQQAQRFVEKYGVVQPYGYHHRAPRQYYGERQYYGYQPQPYYGQPRPRVQYHYGW